MAQPPAPAAPAGTLSRPSTVTVACALFVVAALLMFVQAAFAGTYRDWMRSLIEGQLDLMNVPAEARVAAENSVTTSLVQTAISLVLGGAFWVVLAYFAYRGRNWARVVAIVFGLFAVVAGPLALLFTVALAPPPAVYLLTAVPGMLAIVVGMVLVWRPPAKDWFLAMRTGGHRPAPPQPAQPPRG